MKNNMQGSDLKKYMFGMMAEYDKSGLGRLDFCHLKEISTSKFDYWRSRYLRRGKPKPGLKTEKFVPVSVEPKPVSSSSMLKIEYPNGVVLECGPDLSVEKLKVLLTL